MTTQQEQRPEQLDTRSKKRRRISRRLVIITVLILAVVISIIWILSYLNVIPNFLASIFTVIVTVLGAVFAFFQSMHLFIPADEHGSHENPTQAHASLYIPYATAPSSQIPPIIVQVPTTPLHLAPSQFPDKFSYRGIVGFPPPTDPRAIQQREHAVREVYKKLIQPNITAIALTGIGGVGKSTLAALIYRHLEEQRRTHNSVFLAETLWLTVDPAVTFVDLVGNLFEALGKPLPVLSNLAPQNQAVVLFNALNTTDNPRLIILDQFENLLDWNTGYALADRPSVGEWLDIINSQPCTCRVLLTSRSHPVGTREYPLTYLQEYPVGGLEVSEGVELLRNQGVQGSEAELQNAVSHCAGHAFSLTLLASLMRNHHLALSTLFKNTTLWTGDISTNILDRIYKERLNGIQRELLLAFSVYREPVPLDATLMIISNPLKSQAPHALKILLAQHLLEAVGEGCYQLHAIISDYTQSHFDENDEQANEETLKVAHTKAAQYYLKRAETTSSYRGKRRHVNDIHDLIEAVWQYSQAEKWQAAYDLMEQEEVLEDLNSWGGYATLQELCELMLPLDKWYPNLSQEARIYYILGHSYRVLGKVESAEKYFQWALSRYRELGAPSEEGRTLRNLGRVYSDVGKIKQAGQYFEEAFALSKMAGDAIGEGTALNSLGWVNFVSGQLENAREYYEKALSIHKSTQNYKGESNVLNNLGRVYSALGEKEQAQVYYEQALKLNTEAGDSIGVGLTLHNLGKLYCDLRQNKQALTSLEQALSIRKRIGDLRGEGSTLSAIGQLYLTLEEFDHASKCYEEALRINKAIGDGRGEASSLINLGKICSKLGRKVQAIDYFVKALSLQRIIEDSFGESRTLYYIGKFYFEQKRYDVALSCFVLDKKFLDGLQHPYGEEAQIWIEKIHQESNDEEFLSLLTRVNSQALQIVEQVLRETT